MQIPSLILFSSYFSSNIEIKFIFRQVWSINLYQFDNIDLYLNLLMKKHE